VKGMLGNFAGGVVIIVAATAIGIAQNAVRSNPIKLIQDTVPVSTVRHGETDAAEGDAAALGPADLPEGAISVDEVKRLFDEGVAVIIDSRAPEIYEEGHIPGAINIPYDKLPSYLDVLQAEVVTDDYVVCYCWSPTCDFSDQLATELKILGYENVVVFLGGWEHWTAAGYPVEGTASE
jgi:rhodanese-related sulfurtransferase